MNIVSVVIAVNIAVASEELRLAQEDMIEQHKRLEHHKPRMEDDGEYLCEMYRRGVGGLLWKDQAAAARKKMDVCTYAIGGLHPDLRSRVASVGRRADEKKIRWKITSAFRDDYRQSIATGFRARPGYSRHGNSKVTKGYGDGRAVDFNGSAAGFFGLLKAFGLFVPMRYDPGHVQMAEKARAEYTQKRSKHRVRKTHTSRRQHRR